MVGEKAIKYAVKSLRRQHLKLTGDYHLIRRELEILKTLDHPHIIRLHATYEDKKYFHFVTEYCEGGELLERIVTNQTFNEKEAAVIFKKLVSAITHLHEK